MIKAGLSGGGSEAAKYIAHTCILADEMKQPPSAIQKWDSRDRVLMLAYYQVKGELTERHGKPGR